MMGKLSPRYIVPYPITQRVREVAYHQELLPELPRVHNIFHASQLHKYILDASHIITLDPVQLREDLSYEAQLILVLDWMEK